MAKHTGKGKFAGYVKGRVENELALSTLASKDLISALFSETMEEAGRVASVDLTWSMNDFTDEVGDGPIVVGLAHSDYTNAEMEEAIEAGSGSWGRGNQIAREQANRKVRTVGVFDTTGVALSLDHLNDGLPIKTKLNWYLATGQTISIWAYNAGSAALTTGASVSVLGHANLFIRS